MSLLNRLFLGLAVVSCVFAFLGGRDYWLASKAGNEPDRLTADQFIVRGPSGNPFVEITDFALGENFVYEEKSGKWARVWIPLAALSENSGQSQQVRAVVTSSQIKSENDLDMISSRQTLRGMVMNQIQSLGSKERQLLSDSYPGTDGADVLILDVSKDPVKMRSHAMLFGGMGVVGILASCVIGFFMLVRKR